MSLYEDIKKTLPTRQFDVNERWNSCIEHHPKALVLMDFLMDYDFKELGDSLNWKTGGDGDNGEHLLYALSVFFEYLDYYGK